VATTTEQLLASATEGADLTNVADYVTDPTWLGWLNDGVKELHRFVTNKFKATFFRQYDFTLAAGQSQVTLPSNFWRLKGLDINAGTPRRRAVLPFNFGERNRIRTDYLRDFGPITFDPDRFYNVIGSSLLKIQPEETAAGAYRLYYVPKPKPLAFVRTIVRDVGNDNVNAFAPSVRGMSFTNGLFGLDDIGNIVTIAGSGAPATNNGPYVITADDGPTFVNTDRDLTAVTEFFGVGVTATVTYTLDAELEPYSEYVWLCAAIKSLVKEESFQQAKFLADQRNLIRDDLTEALETDQGGPKTIIDTDDDGGWG